MFTRRAGSARWSQAPRNAARCSGVKPHARITSNGTPSTGALPAIVRASLNFTLYLMYPESRGKKLMALQKRGGHHFLQISGAVFDARPVGFQVDETVVVVFGERVNLTLPVDVSFTKRLPNGLVAIERTILRMYQRDALRVEHLVARGKRLLARDVGGGGVPDNPQIGMIDGGEHTRH